MTYNDVIFFILFNGTLVFIGIVVFLGDKLTTMFFVTAQQVLFLTIKEMNNI